MTGKEKCKLLRQIRQEIAETNGIVYITTDCTYEGDDCKGTCPKCDEEIAYLDAELNRKIADGELITLAGLSLNTFQLGVAETKEISKGFGSDDIPTMGNMVAEKRNPPISGCLELTIEELDLSVRSFNCLKRANINTVADLTQKTMDDMMKVRNLGRKSLEEVIKKLAELGLSLKEDEESMHEGDLIVEEGGLSEEADHGKLLEMSIEELDLSVRSYNCLKRADLNTVGDLLCKSKDDLIRETLLGRKSVEEVINKLTMMGLSLRDGDDDSEEVSTGDLW